MSPDHGAVEKPAHTLANTSSRCNSRCHVQSYKQHNAGGDDRDNLGCESVPGNQDATSSFGRRLPEPIPTQVHSSAPCLADPWGEEHNRSDSERSETNCRSQPDAEPLACVLDRVTRWITSHAPRRYSEKPDLSLLTGPRPGRVK